MITALLIILIILWLLGYVHVGGGYIPDITLFVINGQQITLWALLTLFIIAWIISIITSPFREIAGVLFILWILAILGIFSFGGTTLANILVIAIIIGITISLFSAH